MSKRNRAHWHILIEHKENKGDLPYRCCLEKARQSEITKQYFSQKRMSVKVTGAKYARLVKLAKYQMFVDRGVLK